VAKKYCSKKEKCPNGNKPQDYSNFAPDATAKDLHQSQCRDCDKIMREKVKARAREVAESKAMFFG
jgi:hypothetical protein